MKNILKFCLILLLINFSCELSVAQVKQETTRITVKRKEFTEADLSESQKKIIKEQRADIQKLREEAEKKENEAQLSRDLGKAAKPFDILDGGYHNSTAENSFNKVADQLEKDAKKLREDANEQERLLNDAIKKAIENLKK